jgi:hypothetical protein
MSAFNVTVSSTIRQKWASAFLYPLAIREYLGYHSADILPISLGPDGVGHVSFPRQHVRDLWQPVPMNAHKPFS